ncbi:hypothetical protein QYE76_063460 [Lolium multiflorum]|uniref:Gag-pol polyprotein n=1 Tax=Lolium multiflorum TaxID=4521 RepID=A0AAD8S5R1_LOLMU|nr:hypothetical protein QYE76_063460 [Lolium multiflorum]
MLRHKLTCLINENNLTLDDMIGISRTHTVADDDAGGELAATAVPPHQQKKNRDNGSSGNNKRKNPSDDQKSGESDMVAMKFQRGGQEAVVVEAEPAGASNALTRLIRKHDTSALESTARTAKEAKARIRKRTITVLRQWMRMTLRWIPKRVPQLTNPTPSSKRVLVHTTYTFLGTPTVRAKKSALRILNATLPAMPQYVKWSESPCTFDRTDHPTVIPKECYALVVSPRIDGYDFSKCLMDGGASLNIMYLETLEKMNLTKEQLKHSTTEFHGVVPG